jgi:hypothetical protein
MRVRRLSGLWLAFMLAAASLHAADKLGVPMKNYGDSTGELDLLTGV